MNLWSQLHLALSDFLVEVASHLRVLLVVVAEPVLRFAHGLGLRQHISFDLGLNLLNSFAVQLGLCGALALNLGSGLRLHLGFHFSGSLGLSLELHGADAGHEGRVSR